MNFKPVVASLIALGLSMPVWAADEATNNQEKRHVKHHAQRGHEKHHGKKHGKRHVAHRDTNIDGRHVRVGAVGSAVDGQPVSQYDRQDHFITINSAQSPVSTFDWANRFHFSGEVNVDAKYANPGPLGIVPHPFLRGTEHVYGLNVNNANLYVDVDVNRCVSAHVGIAYVADSVNYFDIGLNSDGRFPFTDAIRSDKAAVWSSGRLAVDEAYITVRDFAASQVYFRAGKMYVDFGHNPDPYPISYSYTQLLTQTRATAAELGWASCYGFYASLFVLDGAVSSRSDDFVLAYRNLDANDRIIVDVVDANNGVDVDVDVDIDTDAETKKGHKVACDDSCDEDDTPVDRVTISRETEARTGILDSAGINNWGAKLGYCGCYCGFEYHLGLSYLQDLRDTDYLAAWQELSLAHRHVGDGLGLGHAGGLDLHADGTYGSFGLSIDYVAAVDGFRSRDDRSDFFDAVNIFDTDDNRLSALDLTATYNSCFFGYNTGFSLSYQQSFNAFPFLPEWRLQGDVGVNIFPNTTLTAEYRYDKDYGSDDNFAFGSTGDGRIVGFNGLGRSTSTAAIRLGVVF